MTAPTRLSILLLLACYVAVTQTVRTHHHVTCEHQTMFLSCGHLPIKVLSANYGRRSRQTCSSHRPTHQVANTNCINRRSFSEVVRRCNGKTTCSVMASNLVFSDPCHGTHKYLYVSYTCTSPKKQTSCENQEMTLNCGPLYINVVSANYGRRDHNTCRSRSPTHHVVNTLCINHRSGSVVATRCNGKTTCSVMASNSVFSDACYGTSKYLEVSYFCTSTNTDLYDTLWERSLDIAEETLEDDFLQRMQGARLSADRYMSKRLQDFYHMAEVTAMLKEINETIQEPADVKEFFEGMSESWQGGTGSALELYHLKDASNILPGQAVSKYLQNYRDAMKLDPIYFAVALLPVYRLWPYLAERLNIEKNTAYYGWQSLMLERVNQSQPALWKFRLLLTKYQKTVDWEQAIALFRRQMQNVRDSLGEA